MATLTAMTTVPTAAQEQAPEQGWMAKDDTFGARLALIRNKMGWGNIAKAAKECGLPTDSWRNWEVDGREPHRMTTIAMTIATRVGCDYLWLVHGPERGGASSTHRYADTRVIVPRTRDDTFSPSQHDGAEFTTVRAVRQTRPVASVERRSRIPVSV